MTYTEWFLFILLIQVIHFLGTWKIYVKAGRKAWEAAVPVYNGIVLMQIIKRPKWWIILLFIPVVNLLMFPVIWIETIRSFGFTSKKDSFLVLITLGLYIYYINYATDAVYREERSLKPQSELGEWISSIAFAIIAATLVHTYFMQPFTIPTSSLEKTLLVGDYLFVSKFHYGARVPMTPIAAPMVHDSIPFTKLKSYLAKPQIPYTRLPGFQDIKRNDIVCFTWPVDSLKTMWGDKSGEFTYKPVDKKTNYVKRCVGIAGDTLSLRDGLVYINGKLNELPDRAKLQFYYTYESKEPITNANYPDFLRNQTERTLVYQISNEFWNDERVQKAFDTSANLTKIGGDSINTEVAGGIAPNLAQRLKMVQVDTKININLTVEEAEKLRQYPLAISVKKISHAADNAIFPHVKSNNWSQDNLGPIYIPEAGKTIQLTSDNIQFYEQIISNYEKNTLEIIGDNFFINGEQTKSYTFKQDYYWMMGDNRHNSLDARYWGFTPFDHVLGKPVFVWFSWDANAPNFGAKIKSIRWDRVFTTVGGNGELTSYFKPFLLLVVLYFVFTFYQRKKKKK